jgi:hypothetical protein
VETREAWEGASVSWEERLLGLLDDLEQQAEGLALTSRDAEVEELARAEYAEVGLASRFHASAGLVVQLTVRGVGPVRGRLARVGSGWCLVTPEEHAGQAWVVALSAVVAVRGLSDRAVAEAARPVVARLGLGSVLRGLAAEGEVAIFRTVDGGLCQGRVLRVGSDFAEVAAESGGVEVLPFAGLAVIGRR